MSCDVVVFLNCVEVLKLDLGEELERTAGILRRAL